MIEGDKVYLRELESDNIDPLYFQWINDKKITRFMASRNQTYSMNDLREYVKSMNDSDSNFLFGIYLKENKKYIGNIKIGNIDSLKNADIGMMIGDSSVWGKGYATDAISCIVNFSFNILSLKKLVADMLKINYGSYKSFKNNGFKDVHKKNNTVMFEGKIESLLFVEKTNR